MKMTEILLSCFLSGVFSFFIGLLFNKGFQWLKTGTVRRFLGKNSPKNIVLTYATLYPPTDENVFRHKQRKGGEVIREAYRVYPAVSEAEVRSIAYLNSFCSQNNIAIQIKSDEKTDSDFESDLISIGFACFKSFDIINNNLFFEKVNNDFFQIKGNNRPFRRNKKHPYGIIIRTTNDLGNTRIVCGGFNEWGTSGAVFCLCKKYKHIVESIHAYRWWFTRLNAIPDFLVITEGAIEMDEKSKIIEVWILNKNQMPVRVYPCDNSVTHNCEPVVEDESLS